MKRMVTGATIWSKHAEGQVKVQVSGPTVCR